MHSLLDGVLNERSAEHVQILSIYRRKRLFIENTACAKQQSRKQKRKNEEDL